MYSNNKVTPVFYGFVYFDPVELTVQNQNVPGRHAYIYQPVIVCKNIQILKKEHRT